MGVVFKRIDIKTCCVFYRNLYKVFDVSLVAVERGSGLVRVDPLGTNESFNC